MVAGQCVQTRGGAHPARALTAKIDTLEMRSRMVVGSLPAMVAMDAAHEVRTGIVIEEVVLNMVAPSIATLVLNYEGGGAGAQFDFETAPAQLA